MHMEGLVVVKAHLKGFLFRPGSLEDPWSIPGAGGNPAFAEMARREGEGKASTRRQTKEKMKQMEKCT